jgi:hypothetical protein
MERELPRAGPARREATCREEEEEDGVGRWFASVGNRDQPMRGHGAQAVESISQDASLRTWRPAAARVWKEWRAA